jgi:hypothetical protein
MVDDPRATTAWSSDRPKIGRRGQVEDRAADGPTQAEGTPAPFFRHSTSGGHIARRAMTWTAFFCLACIGAGADDGAEVIPRALLFEDARQLLETLEDTHPDPHLAGGGRIAFHRRFHRMMAAIPAEGLSGPSFYELLLPFVAAIGDSHTGLRLQEGAAEPIYLPLAFKIIDKQLVVEKVAGERLRPYLGARLASIEGVELCELLTRQSAMRGMENLYGHMAILCLRTLTTRQGLHRLVPEWSGGDSLRVALTLPHGESRAIELTVLRQPPDVWIAVPTAVAMPSIAASDVAYTFLDADRSTALLVVADLMRYREACELWFADGFAPAEEMARAAYEHFHGTPAPEDRAALLAGIPSATETIVELVDELTAAGSQSLIVDLRGNTGGSSVLREMLVYLLYGRSAMLSLDTGYEIVKLSKLLFEQYEGVTLERINAGRACPLRSTDLDFGDEDAYRRGAVPSQGDGAPSLGASPTFWRLYQSGVYHQPRWTPRRVLVLCSPTTFSSGFNVLTGLLTMGAQVVGTPSAQPGNNFGDVLRFRLRNTGIEGFVSHKQIVAFPDDLATGQCLEPHYPLTLARFADFDFDPNAEVLLALEVLAAAGAADDSGVTADHQR